MPSRPLEAARQTPPVLYGPSLPQCNLKLINNNQLIHKLELNILRSNVYSAKSSIDTFQLSCPGAKVMEGTTLFWETCLLTQLKESAALIIWCANRMYVCLETRSVPAIRGCLQMMSAAKGGGRGLKMLTFADKGGRGVKEMLTLGGKWRRGCLANSDIIDKNA